jgi:hypothetical protein
MHKITFGISAKLTRDDAKDISLLVHRYSIEQISPCVVVENGLNRVITGGHIESLEQVFQLTVRKHPGYTVQERAIIEVEVPEQPEVRTITETPVGS